MRKGDTIKYKGDDGQIRKGRIDKKEIYDFYNADTKATIEKITVYHVVSKNYDCWISKDSIIEGDAL